MKGFVDNINSNYISGWCFDEQHLLKPLKVELYIDGELLLETEANIHRRGIFENGTHPSGNVGFNFDIEQLSIDEKSQVKVKVKDTQYIFNSDQVFERFRTQYLLSKNSPFRGVVDNININYISGWCFNRSLAMEPVIVELYVNHQKIQEERADIHRRGIVDAGLHSSGNAGFNFAIDETLLDENSIIEIKVKGSNYVIDEEVALARFKENMFFIQPGKEAYIKKKKRCIVHVGMHKTGSSSIQENLYNKKNNINFSYFDLGVANHSVPMFTLFTDAPKANDYMNKMGFDEDGVAEYMAKVDARFRKHLSLNYDYEVFILSGEGMNVLSKNALDKLKEYLLQFFEEINIVAYVRAPIAYINSVFQERVKAGLGNFSTMHMLYPRYNHKLYKFDLVFGKENVFLHYFDRAHLEDGDVTVDFLKKNHLKVHNQHFIVTNETLSLEAIALLYVYYKFGLGYGVGEKNKFENNQLLKSLSKFGTRQMKIDKSVLQMLILNNKNDIQWIEERLGMPILDETYYPEPGQGIGSEEELIQVAITVTDVLKEYIGDVARTKVIRGDSIDDVVALVHLLRVKEKEKKKKIKSRIGHINKNAIRGWCFDEDDPLRSVQLELYIDGVKIDEKTAKDHRKTLLEQGLHPTANVGFRFSFDNIVLDAKSNIEIKVKDEDIVLDLGKAKEEFDLFLRSRQVLYKKADLPKRKKLCIVHIGMHKTGSTSIQEMLHQGDNKNFSYFKLDRKNHGIPLFSLFTDVPENYHVHISMGLTKRHVYRYNIEVDKMFREHLALHPEHETFVISGEDICVLSERALKDFKNYLLMFFEQVRIVAYVRPPVSYMNSAFQQIVKEGRMKFPVNNIYPKYRFKIEKFDTVFGKEHVHVNFFQKESLRDGDIVSDFLHKNDLEIEGKIPTKSNVSLSLEAVALLYVYYILGPGRQGADNLIKVLEGFGSRKVKLGKQVLKPILDEKVKDIQWIESRMQLPLLDASNYATDNYALNSEEDLVNIAKYSLQDLRSFVDHEEKNDNMAEVSLSDVITFLDILVKK